MRQLAISVILVLATLMVFSCRQESVLKQGTALKRTITESVLIDDCSQARQITASPNLRRVAYSAQMNDKEFIVVDGLEGKQYDSVGWLPTFSPDSQHVAYIANVGGNGFGGDWFVIVDGQEGKPYDWVESIVYSPDSGHFAYSVEVYNVQTDRMKGFIVVDGVEGEQYDAAVGLTFSPDSSRFAYTAEVYTTGVSDKWLVILDGQEGKQYDNAGFPTFSPDSQHFVYVAEAGDKWFTVLDGQEGKKYEGDGLLFPTFSPDSRRLAFFAFAKPGHKWFVVVDGQEGKEYEISNADETILGFNLVFSPDSNRIAYSGKLDSPEVGESWFTVVDGQESKHYDGVAFLTFSPDSQRFAYIARAEGREFVVMDGQEGKRYDSVGPIAFSPDSQHFAYTAEVDGKYFVVVDKVEGKQYGQVIPWIYYYGILWRSYMIVFDSSNSLHYIVQEGDKVYQVDEKIESTYGNNIVETIQSDGTSKILKPADLRFTSLIVTPKEVTPGSNVTATVEITNGGELVGDCEATLKLNDRDMETKTVLVAGSVTAKIDFTVLVNEPGEYTISVGTLTDTLVVLEPAELKVAILTDRNLEATIREAIKKPEGKIYFSDLESITTLVAQKRGIINLDGLEYCINLQILDLGANQIISVKPLAGLVNLTQLNLTENNITDISPVAGLNKLRGLNLGDNNVSDISPLAGLINLRELGMETNNVSNISSLEKLVNLEDVSFVNNKINNLSPLARLTNIKNLGLGQNDIVDLRPLVGLTRLQTLNLWTNKISDLSPLAGLTDLETLLLAENNISDINPLQNLTKLRQLLLQNNRISDITALVNNQGLSSGDKLTLTDNPLSDTAVNVHVPQLKARGVIVLYDVQVPEPKVVSRPTIDGTITSGEWDTALKTDFTVRIPGGSLVPGTLYATHDGEKLYIAVKFAYGTISPGDALYVHFDNNGTGGARAIGDDVIQISNNFYDMYVTAVGSSPDVGVNVRADIMDGGQTDGTGIRSTDGTYTTYEFSHPLDSSDDLHDFSLKPGDTFAFTTVVQVSTEHSSFPTAWTIKTDDYMRILIRPSTLELVR